MALLEFSEVATRYSVAEYEALAGDPAWEDRRVELIRGVILEMSPLSELHERVLSRLARWLFSELDPDAIEVRVASALRTSDSEPQPDLMVFGQDRPADQLPGRALLVIEVSVSSERRDTQVKPAIYAENVAEYWVVLPERRHVIVHRDPEPGGYATVTTHTPDTDLDLDPKAVAVKSPLDLVALFTTP